MTEKEYEDLMLRRGLVPVGRVKPAEPPKKPRRYRNEPVVVDGIKFDSKKEADCYRQLSIWQKHGRISDLRLQVPFELAPPVKLDGRKKPALRFVADFVYEKDGATVVADAKSAATSKDKVYRIKKHLMVHVHGIHIEEL